MLNKRIEREVIRLAKLVEAEQDKEVKRLAKRYKGDYKTLDKELRKLFKEYEEDGKINYSQLSYDGKQIELDYIIALNTVSRYLLIQEATEKALETSANETIKRMTNIKGIPEIRKTFNTKQTINKDMAGLNWIDRTNNNRNEFIYDLQDIVKNGLETGRTYSDMSQEIAKQLSTDMYKAERIIRTESMRVMDDAKLDVFREINKEVEVYKTWVTVQDERVREAHSELDGVTIPLEENFKSPAGGVGLMPRLMDNPADSINCRCNVKMVLNL